MELLEDPIFKNKYQKYKLRVKLWESDFMEKYGRKPNKNDIKEADATIKEAYKMYWTLKTRALEESLTDITFCDDIQTNVSINSPSNSIIENSEDKSFMNDSTNDTENIDPHKKQHPQESISMNNSNSSGSANANVKGVWGSHLSKTKAPVTQHKQGLLVGRSHSFQLSQNKFTSSSFTKRNPRKSLSLNKIKSKLDVTKDLDISSPVIADQASLDTTDGFGLNEDTKHLFGGSLKVVHTEFKTVSQRTNVVQSLMDGQANNVNRNLNQGWLERCSKENNIDFSVHKPQRLSGKSDSGIESIESSLPSPKENTLSLDSTKSFALSDEEDFICNSDSEEERKNKRIRNFKKRLSNEGGNPNKRLCTEVDSSPSVSEQVSLPHDSTNNDSITVIEKPNVYNTIDDIASLKINKVEETTTILPFDVPSQNLGNTLVSKNKSNDENVTTSNDITDATNATKNQTEVLSSDNTIMLDNIAKTNDDKKSPKKTADRRKPIRRRKQIKSSDSDPGYTDDEQETAKNKMKKIGKLRSGAKKDTNIDNTNNHQNTNDHKTMRKKKTSRKKKKVQSESSDISDTESNSKPSEIPIYGVETLAAVPRFAMNVPATGDLLADFSRSVNSSKPGTSVAPIKAKSKQKLTDKEKLEQKIAAGKVNENFVRINIKKKVFVRGKKQFNFSKYKKNQWKQRKKELASSETNMYLADLMDKNGTLTCFKCGESGHFSRNCPSMKTDTLMPLEDVPEAVSLYPTLEEAEQMASQAALAAHGDKINRLPDRASRLLTADEAKLVNDEEDDTIHAVFEDDFAEPFDESTPSGHKIPDELLSRLLPPETSAVNPLYPVGKDNSLCETPAEVFETLRMFGHESFRPGQEKAIMRVLSGQSTLVTLSTGSGKSLCYQLPAYLYSKYSHCITLVISPLVSLMDDQVTGVPSFLSAACLHTSQAPRVKDQVMDMVKKGQLNILLVSPEAVVAGEKSTGFGALLRQLPPIAFACIDEAHCISQWSHNFRPSYLMISRVLKEKLKVRTVLGLTATATKATAEGIVRHLHIHDGLDGVISDIPMPRNLLLTVSKDVQRDHALVSLLKSERFKTCDSVIIYCTRREECARIAALLRVSLQDPKDYGKSNTKVSSISEAYHAGLTFHRRKVVQKAFMGSRTRIVVATVAFGMGINKADIRSVIHYNMPATFEGYVQEVGRAGRDGLPAQCHLFLNPDKDRDKWELRRHIYANGVDRYMIRRLLEKVFVPCSCIKTKERLAGRRCAGHEVAIPVDETVRALDIPEETISTLLCYLELHPKRFITVLSSVYVTAKVSSYSGPQALKKAAQSSPPLAMAIALDQQKGISHDDSTLIEFQVVDVASAIGWDSGVVKSHLKNLEWQNVDGKVRRSAISVQYHTLGLRVKAPGDLSDAELDEALEALFDCTQTQETAKLEQLEAINIALHKNSVKSIDHCLSLSEVIVKKSDDLKDTIRVYFDNKGLTDIDLDSLNTCTNEAELTGDIRSFILSYRDTSFTGRAVARIFHGIQSPNYPALVWGKCRFWRLHISTNFNAICQIATKEILALR